MLLIKIYTEVKKGESAHFTEKRARSIQCTDIINNKLEAAGVHIDKDVKKEDETLSFSVKSLLSPFYPGPRGQTNS